MAAYSSRLPICLICCWMQRFSYLSRKSVIQISSVDCKLSSTRALQSHSLHRGSTSYHYKQHVLEDQAFTLCKSFIYSSNFHSYQSPHHAQVRDKNENESLFDQSGKISPKPFIGNSNKGRRKEALLGLSERITVEEVLINDDCEFYFQHIDRELSDAQLRQLLAKERQRHTIIVEGVRLAKEALQAGVQPKSVYFCNAEILSHLNTSYFQLRKTKLYRVSPYCMKLISDTVTPAGLLVVFKKPHEGEAISPPRSTLPITLILDSLKDPGNAGTLIRTAVAAGCQRIIAIEGSVNVWERKVLRSAMGAHFNLPIYTNVKWSDITNFLDKETQILLADSDRSTQQQIYQSLDQNRPSEEEQKGEKLPEVDLETMKLTNAKGCLHVKTNMPSSVPSFTYSDVALKLETPTFQSDCGIQTLPNLALVVGSETAGLSSTARQIASDMQGAYISIPMSETVTSLNSGIAGSIILYELRKKLMKIS